MMKKLKTWWAGGEDKSGGMRPIHYFVVILAIGMAMMILTDFLHVEREEPLGLGDFSSQEPEPPAHAVAAMSGGGAPDLIAEYENMYETQLKEILSTVAGVGEVEVMVNLESTPELVVEKNTNTRTSTNQETDKDKATRNQSEQSRDEQVVVIQGGKQDQPVIVKTMKPRVRGVLVVAKGAENIQVKAWMTEAVQKVLDVPVYKISILPKKG